MGINYKIIGEVAVAQAKDAIGKEELESVFAAIKNDPYFNSETKILIDIRMAEYKPSSEEIRNAASMMRSFFGSDSPIALVADKDASFATGRMLEVYCESEGVVFQAFRKLEDAAKWLEEGDP
jgi:hypothetical protein